MAIDERLLLPHEKPWPSNPPVADLSGDPAPLRASEQKGFARPQPKLIRISKRFDWSELWEKCAGWTRRLRA